MKIFIPFGLVLFAALAIHSKAQVITGKIIDHETGRPLPGASVQMKNSLRGSVSSSEGTYLLKVVPGKKSLVRVSFIGYSDQFKEFELLSDENVEWDVSLMPVSIEQDEVIVTGIRTETARSNIPLSTSVISTSVIENSAETTIMPLLGSQVPGVFVTERGITGFGVAEGAAGKVSIRGVGSGDQSRLLIMIDGQPQVMGIFGHAFPDMYQTSNVERIEIIRGPGSLLYGSNAMGGVINMITKKQSQDGFSARLSASAGSFGTYRATVASGFQQKNFSVYASYNHDQTNGARENSMFRGDNGYLSLRYRMGPHFDISWTSNYSKFYAVDPGPINTATPEKYAKNGAWADIGRVNSMLTLNNHSDKIKGHIKLFFNQGDHALYDNWVSTDRNYGLSVFEGFTFFEGNLIGTGIDWNRYGGIGSPVMVPKFIENAVKWIPSEYNNKWIDVQEFGAYVFVQQHLFGMLTLNGGIRFNQHSLYGETWIPQLGVTGKITSNDELKALVSKGFRSPTVKELYFFPPANPELRPESMWNYELGYTRYALNRKLKAAMTLFYIVGENLIQAIPNPGGGIPPMVNQNTGAFQNYGAEVEASYAIKPNLRATMTYSYLHTDVPRIASPNHQLTAHTRYLLGKFDFNISVQAVMGLYTLTDLPATTDIHEEEIQNFVLVNAKVNYALFPSVTLFVSADNLLNAKYSTIYGYPMPGVTLLGGISVKIN